MVLIQKNHEMKRDMTHLRAGVSLVDERTSVSHPASKYIHYSQLTSRLNFLPLSASALSLHLIINAGLREPTLRTHILSTPFHQHSLPAPVLRSGRPVSSRLSAYPLRSPSLLKPAVTPSVTHHGRRLHISRQLSFPATLQQTHCPQSRRPPRIVKQFADSEQATAGAHAPPGWY